MAGWRQGVEPVAALIGLAAVAAMASAAPGAETAVVEPAARIARLAEAFASGGDPRALLAAEGARFDDRLAARGEVEFAVPGLAAMGSAYVVATAGRPTRAERLTIVPEGRLTLSQMIEAVGPVVELPALAGAGYRYAAGPGEGLARPITIELDGDPGQPLSRVTSVTCQRRAAQKR